MMLKRAVALTLLVATSPIWAGGIDSKPVLRPDVAPMPAHHNDGANQLTPRRVFVKPRSEEIVRPVSTTGRLFVKFRDDVKARANVRGELESRTRANLAATQAILDEMNLELQPAITLPEQTLAELEARARAYSGREQPDLGGLMYLSPPAGADAQLMVRAAQRLNDRPEIEYVSFEPVYETPYGGDDIGACCVPLGSEDGMVTCVVISQQLCNQSGGVYQGDNTVCDPMVPCDDYGACCLEQGCETLTQTACEAVAVNEEDPWRGVGSNCSEDQICSDFQCGHPFSGDCFECHDPNGLGGGRYCNDQECCMAVCQIDPFCCEEDANFPGGIRGAPHWDELCVLLAYQFCPGPPENVCLSGFGGPCFTAAPTPGCSNSICCQAVCAVDPFCCAGFWDFDCVDLAFELCQDIVGGTTPNYAPGQGYLTSLSYQAQHGADLPLYIGGGIIFNPCDDPLDPNPTYGYGGEGFDLQGMWEFAELLIELGTPVRENYTRGKTIKVAVIEHTAFCNWQDNNNPLSNHEELLGRVIVEPNQTQVINPNNPGSPLSGHHGTACLGIIGARDDGMPGHSLEALAVDGDEVGIVGMVPEAELYFYPIVSLEEGGRTLNAIANALTTFGPGDVMSFSIGPAGCGTLVSDAATWMMIRFASDMGVTSCIAAGNSCCNLDGVAQFQGQESDAIIVGAVTPGFPYCRLGFSNFCQTCSDAHAVHIAAWGAGVATLGYGDLLLEGNMRSYTMQFNGTSAATPQIASLAAALQGIAKMVYGIPLTPIQLREFVIGSAGYNQCGAVSRDATPGPSLQNPCIGDFDPEEEIASVAADRDPPIAYPDVVDTAESVLRAGIYDGNPLLQDVVIVRGQHEFGNSYSLRAADNNHFVVSSIHTDRSHRPVLSGPAGRVGYIATSQTTDIVVSSQLRSYSPTLFVQTRVVSPEQSVLVLIEIYNSQDRKWEFLGVAPVLAGAEYVFDTSVANAARFIDRKDRRVYIRIYSLSMGGFTPSGQLPFVMHHDLVRVTHPEAFGIPGGPSGSGLGN